MALQRMSGFWASAFLHAMTFSKFGPNGTDFIRNQQAVDISSLTSEEARRSIALFSHASVREVYGFGHLRVNMKKEQLLEERYSEIDRTNQILLQKIHLAKAIVVIAKIEK